MRQRPALAHGAITEAQLKNHGLDGTQTPVELAAWMKARTGGGAMQLPRGPSMLTALFGTRPVDMISFDYFVNESTDAMHEGGQFSFTDEGVPGAFEDLRVWQNIHSPEGSMNDNIISFGPPDTPNGLPLHFHGPAMLGLLSGVKHWFLVAPEDITDTLVQMTMNPARLLADERYFPRSAAAAEAAEPLPEGLIHCVQRRGDVMYVPSAWWHATVNGVGVGPTMGFGGQHNPHKINIKNAISQAWARQYGDNPFPTSFLDVPTSFRFLGTTLFTRNDDIPKVSVLLSTASSTPSYPRFWQEVLAELTNPLGANDDAEGDEMPAHDGMMLTTLLPLVQHRMEALAANIGSSTAAFVAMHTVSKNLTATYEWPCAYLPYVDKVLELASETDDSKDPNAADNAEVLTRFLVWAMHQSAELLARCEARDPARAAKVNHGMSVRERLQTAMQFGEAHSDDGGPLMTKVTDAVRKSARRWKHEL